MENIDSSGTPESFLETGGVAYLRFFYKKAPADVGFGNRDFVY
jgi:hypothetical protein